MPKYQPKIIIESENIEHVKQLSSLVQHTINVVDHEDLIKLLTKVKNKPTLVKKALNFI